VVGGWDTAFHFNLALIFRVPILATTAQAALEKADCGDSTCDDEDFKGYF